MWRCAAERHPLVEGKFGRGLGTADVRLGRVEAAELLGIGLAEFGDRFCVGLGFLVADARDRALGGDLTRKGDRVRREAVLADHAVDQP